MKANEVEKMYIPKKIYLPYKDGKIIGLVKDTGVPYKSGVDGNIEYTRTDAFIDKACEWIRSEFKIASGYYSLDDFKKYMKGE